MNQVSKILEIDSRIKLVYAKRKVIRWRLLTGEAQLALSLPSTREEEGQMGREPYSPRSPILSFPKVMGAGLLRGKAQLTVPLPLKSVMVSYRVLVLNFSVGARRRSSCP